MVRLILISEKDLSHLGYSLKQHNISAWARLIVFIQQWLRTAWTGAIHTVVAHIILKMPVELDGQEAHMLWTKAESLLANKIRQVDQSMRFASKCISSYGPLHLVFWKHSSNSDQIFWSIWKPIWQNFSCYRKAEKHETDAGFGTWSISYPQSLSEPKRSLKEYLVLIAPSVPPTTLQVTLWNEGLCSAS